MSEIYLKHPQHGLHVVFDFGAVEQHRKWGWIPVEEVVPDTAEEPTKEPETKIDTPKKRGRPKAS